MIEAQYDERLGVVAPLTQLPRLMTALPAVRLNTRTFAAYANASLHDVLGRGLEGAQHLQAATLDHTVFFNRGGTFQGVALPPEAQFAPAFYAGVADFDGDGHEDLFLAQNFFPTEIGTRRYDAGRGLLLLGQGGGTLVPVPGQVDRKSTRLNSSHDQISYAVFCLKKKNEINYRGIEAFNESGVEGIIPFVHPEFESTTPPNLAAEPDTYSGYDCVRSGCASFFEVM